MAKTAKLKHVPTSNPRSRASKRETSPGINTDKSLKTISPPPASVLAPRPNAGVTKRRKRGAQSSKQKARQEKRLERAEVVMDRMEVKVRAVEKKSKVRKARSGDWKEVNGEGPQLREERRRALLGVKEAGAEWEDVDADADQSGGMEEVEEEESFVTALGEAVPAEDRAPAALGAVTNGAGDVDEADEVDKIT